MVDLRAFTSTVILILMDVAVAADWNEKFPALLEGYNPCDMIKWMRQASFSGQLRTKLCIKNVKNVVGDEKTPLLIWNLLKSCCFKHVKKKTLPIEYHANKKALMASGIFET